MTTTANQFLGNKISLIAKSPIRYEGTSIVYSLELQDPSLLANAARMRVGRDYQAKIPPLIPKEERNVQAETDKALLVWCPSERLTDEQVEQYLSVARDKYQYSGEQALGLLFWHRYDITKALQDLGNFTPNPEEWTIEDKVLFEQAFQFHGKAFDRIRQMLPEKSMSTLIRYYYRWKKLRCKTSVMDRQVKKFTQEDGGDDQNAPPVSNNNLPPTIQQQASQQNTHSIYHHLPLQPNSAGHRSTVMEHDDSDSDDIIKQNTEEGKMCGNCGVPSSALQGSKDMCNTCFLYWKRTGDIRPLTGPLRRGDRQMMGLACVHQRRNPPKGMYINHDDLTMLASAPPQAENVTLQSLEKEVLEVKCRVQSTKQAIELLKTMTADGIEQCKPSKESVPSTSSRINSRWTQEELMLAAQGVRRYGKNFQKIAEVMGTKSEAHLRSFYANYRRRYNLDNLVQEHILEESNLDDAVDNNNDTSTSSIANTPNTPNTSTSSSNSTSMHNGSGIKPRCLEF